MPAQPFAASSKVKSGDETTEPFLLWSGCDVERRHAFHSAIAMAAPTISASHDAGGKPSSRRGLFSSAALHLMQEPCGAPHAAQVFSLFDFMVPTSAAKHQVRLRFGLGGSGWRFFPAVWAICDVIRATASTIRTIHGSSSLVIVPMILSV